MSPPSITEIAQELGLDKSTVSRALRGDLRVKAATRQRILDYATVRNYQRNPTLSALSEVRWRRKGNRSLMNWGFLITEHDLLYPENLTFLEDCKHFAKEAGYTLNAVEIGPDTRADVVNRIIKARNIRGMIVNHLYRASTARALDFDAINRDSSRWIYCGNFFFEPRGFRIVDDSFENTTIALRAIRKKGYRQIALIYPRIIAKSWDMSRYRAASMEFVRAHDDLQVRFFEMNQFEDLELERDVIACSDALLLSYMVEHRKLPTKLKALPFAELPLLRSEPEISGIRRDPKAFAQTTVDLLDFQCRRSFQGLDPQSYTILVKGKWWDGETLPEKGRVGH